MSLKQRLVLARTSRVFTKLRRYAVIHTVTLRSASCLRLLRSLFQERKATLTREFKGGQRVGPTATVNATTIFSYIVCGERSLIL